IVGGWLSTSTEVLRATLVPSSPSTSTRTRARPVAGGIQGTVAVPVSTVRTIRFLPAAVVIVTTSRRAFSTWNSRFTRRPTTIGADGWETWIPGGLFRA